MNRQGDEKKGRERKQKEKVTLRGRKKNFGERLRESIRQKN